ncbi:hypothetical protein [Desulfoscipio gibsoniae]|uniref:Uncharacterized protein n=1 Tax=Desulfoscipio gibsoniae DSM 7213 TaxID=767817 RepID=R4KGF8_9FIRM|nr:hypothetical protein [Desulfoscipio gibsoniae]AGL00747.1 hypothetical protein Desgi_1226 [Desulfoscipio gibsoniae DSM 7213]
MIERFLRSPFTMCLFLVGMGLIYAFGIVTERRGYPFLFIVIGFALFTVTYFGLMLYYNYKYPTRKIPIFTYIPYELKEEDEGHQYFTYRACRKVYIYYYFAIPISIGLIIVFREIEWMPVFLLVALGLGQYFTYWSEIKKLND